MTDFLEFSHNGDLYQVSINHGVAYGIVRFPQGQRGTEMSWDECDFLLQAKIQSLMFDTVTVSKNQSQLPPSE